jgi:hypothetical protein
MLDESITRKKPRLNQEKNAEADYAMSWICSECKEAECMMKADAEQLLICEGTCHRVFHFPCAGLAELPAKEDSYTCNDCIEGKHPCSICNGYGKDNEDVFLCSKSKCGLYFHEACLSMRNVDMQLVHENGNRIIGDPSLIQVHSEKRVFVCPAHACWTCSQLDLRKQESDAAKGIASEGGKNGKKHKKKKSSSSFATKSAAKIMVSMPYRGK